jgi:hypothetical protein
MNAFASDFHLLLVEDSQWTDAKPPKIFELPLAFNIVRVLE